MPVIHPFRATHYNLAKVGDLSKVVTQPYDKIDDALQQTYYDRHPANIVRVIRGKETPGDTDEANVYTRAAATFQGWLASEILVRRAKPAIYAYHQTYTWIDGTKKTRKGFVSMLQLEDFSSGKVRPHETTLAGPKADRLNLLRATRAHFGQIFMLYADPEHAVERTLAPHTRNQPVLSATDDDGHLHQVWEVADAAAIRQVAERLRDVETFIADGHHRYETALNFRNEMRATKARPAETESSESVMTTLINLSDEGLSLFPTHRVIHSLADWEPDRFLPALSSQFSVETVDSLEVLLARMLERRDAHAVGLSLAEDPRLRLLTLLPSVDLDAEIAEAHSSAWKRLDVSILHTLILERRLGIGAEALKNEKNLHYVRDARKAVEMTRKGDTPCPAAFLINPTRVEEVQKVAQAGDRMPQKSTDFYPKLLTGLLVCRLESN